MLRFVHGPFFPSIHSLSSSYFGQFAIALLHIPRIRDPMSFSHFSNIYFSWGGHSDQNFLVNYSATALYLVCTYIRCCHIWKKVLGRSCPGHPIILMIGTLILQRPLEVRLLTDLPPCNSFSDNFPFWIIAPTRISQNLTQFLCSVFWVSEVRITL